jgi:hypothetical protein
MKKQRWVISVLGVVLVKRRKEVGLIEREDKRFQRGTISRKQDI